MRASQAINKAMAVFNKAKKGDLRTVALWEGSGSGDNWQSVTIHIGYAVDGDYKESDAHPFLVTVYETADGKIHTQINK